MRFVFPFKHAGGRARLAGLIGLLVLAFGVIGFVPSAQAWYARPQTLPGQQAGYNINGHLAMDGQGRVFATWVYVPFDFGKSSIAYARGLVDGAGNIAWENPIELSGRNGAGTPRIAVGSNGRVHLVYVDRVEGVRYLENRNNGDPGSWGETQTLGSGFTPDIEVGSDNQVYLTYADLRNNTAPVIFRWRTADGAWSGEASVLNAGALARNNRLVVTGAGTGATVHIVFEYKVTEREPFAIGYVRGTPNGSFGNLRNLNQETSAPAGITPEIALDPGDGTVAIVWVAELPDGFAIAYTQSGNGGAGWENARIFRKGVNDWTFLPSLVLRDRVAHIAVNAKEWTGSAFAAQTINYISFNRANGAVSGFDQLGSASLSAFPVIAANQRYAVILMAQTIGDNDVQQYTVQQISDAPIGPLPPTATPVPPTPAVPTATPVPTPTPVEGPPPYGGQYASPRFQQVWERTDRPLAEGRLSQQRSWIWGPQPRTGSYQEPYAESPGGSRLVQYFDKSRMEINNPNDDAVSNGLLVVEMIEGRIQVGNSAFRDFRPAEQAVAGDVIETNPNAPTYASFRTVAFPINVERAPNRNGQTVTQVLSRPGSVSENADLGRYNVVIGGYDNTLGHNIPRVFVDYFNQRGQVFENGSLRQDQVIDQLFAVGLPISEPYWTRVRVGGVEKDVLVQAFQRRIVTYTPDNPDGFKVEMGNVGHHYLRWRYGR